MGSCFGKPDGDFPVSKEARERHKAIEKQIDQERKELSKETYHKLLLLGPSEAGKSTILKQLRIIYSRGMSVEERNSYRLVIVTNVLTSIAAILMYMERNSIPFESPDLASAKDTILTTYKTALETYARTNTIDPTIPPAVTTLWADPAVKTATEAGSTYNLIDSAPYFLDRAPEIFTTSYSPVDQDILRSRVMTTAVTETRVTVNRVGYRVYDVAGHRGMRHVWASYFEDCRAVIFVVAISAYDQVLAEDPSVNRMKDAMQLFAAVCNHPLFKMTSVILLLNKIDIFRRKIRVRPIDRVFKDYKGGADYNQATGYFARTFVRLNKNPEKQIYTHLTWATDTKATKVVLAAVTDTVQRIALRLAGVL